MVDYRAPSYNQFPHRKPVVGSSMPPPVPAKHALRINPSHNLGQNLYGPPSATSPSSPRARRRTSSSGTLPYDPPPFYYYPSSTTNTMYRRPSTTTKGGSLDPTIPVTIKRSASTYTANSAATSSHNAYVATLRRQKATVWCDRSQSEDPCLMAALQAARLRAAVEVVGSSTSAFLNGYNHHGLGSATGSAASSVSGGRTGKLGRSSTHGKSWTTAATTSPPGIGGGSLPSGVPARLSATEVLGDDDDDIEGGRYGGGGVPAIRARSGSGRSSLNSNHRRTNRTSSMMSDANRNVTLQHRTSNGSTPSRSSRSSAAAVEEATPPSSAAVKKKPKGMDSGPSPYSSPTVSSAVPRRDNTLKRRGSLDEQEVVRTMTLSGNRLFVANPDVE